MAGSNSPQTGRAVLVDIPRSPLSTAPSQRIYWIGSGLSKPYSCLICAISSGEANSGITALIGSPGARCTKEKQTIDTPTRIGRIYAKRRRVYQSMGYTSAATSPVFDPDPRQILKPALCLHEALQLARQSARIHVVHHPDPDCLVDEICVQLSKPLVLLVEVELPQRPRRKLVRARVGEIPPIVSGHTILAVICLTDEAKGRILNGPTVIDPVYALVQRTMCASHSARAQRLPIHTLQRHVDTDFAHVLLDELVHRQRLHLTGAGGRHQELDLHRILRPVTCFGQQFTSRVRVVFYVEDRLAEPWMVRC